MITLFAVVVIAVFVLAVTRAEGMRPLGLALVGMISLVLGVRATAVFTESSITPLVNAVVSAQDNNGSDATNVAADVPDPPATSSTDTVSTDTSPSDSAPGDEPFAPGTAKVDTQKDTATTEENADDDATVAADDETAEHDEPTSPQPVSPQPVSPPAVSPPAASPLVDSATSDHETGAPKAEAVSPVTPLKVEAITSVEYPDRGDDAPQWLEKKSWTKDGVHFVPVVSRLQISEPDSDAALKKEIKQATDVYVNRLLENKHATTLLNLRSDSTTPQVTERFQEQVVVTAGTMHQSHALLAFDDTFRDAVGAKWDEVRATSRLMQTGLGAGIVLLLLSTMFSYFKLDTATRGYYTGRLQFAAAAAILAVIAASVLFANYVPWM